MKCFELKNNKSIHYAKIVNTFESNYDFLEIRSSMANLSKEALR